MYHTSQSSLSLLHCKCTRSLNMIHGPWPQNHNKLVSVNKNGSDFRVAGREQVKHQKRKRAVVREMSGLPKLYPLFCRSLYIFPVHVNTKCFPPTLYCQKASLEKCLALHPSIWVLIQQQCSWWPFAMGAYLDCCQRNISSGNLKHEVVVLFTDIILLFQHFQNIFQKLHLPVTAAILQYNI